MPKVERDQKLAHGTYTFVHLDDGVYVSCERDAVHWGILSDEKRDPTYPALNGGQLCLSYGLRHVMGNAHTLHYDMVEIAKRLGVDEDDVQNIVHLSDMPLHYRNRLHDHTADVLSEITGQVWTSPLDDGEIDRSMWPSL